MSIEAEVERWVGVAMVGLDSRRDRLVDDAAVGLAQLCDRDPEQRETLGVLTARLRSGVTSAWQSGWQPADVHRLAGRRTSTGVQELVRDLIAEELSSYAPATLHPQWRAQVAELDAVPWWGREESLLLAHRRRGLAWFELMEQSVLALHLLSRMPRIERITPLPGEFADTTTDSGQSVEVDDRILSKVRQLLAKAESTTFEAEAETFTAGAQAMMARHRISEAMLAAEATGPGATGPHARRIGVDNPYETPKAHLLSAVADANGCRMIWSKELGFGTVVGHDSDLEGVEVLYTSLLVQATRAMTAEGSRADRRGRSRTRAFRSSFLMSYAHRIGERLRTVAREEERSAAAEVGAAGRGRELVPVLAARAEEVAAAVDELFPSLQTHRSRATYDAEGWHSGRAAADQARLGRSAAAVAGDC